MRKVCAVIKLSRVVYLYKSNARDNSALVMRMKEITQTRVHYGYRRVHVMLRREGFRDNHKRVYRLYREQGWSLRQKRPKRNKAAQLRQPMKLALHINQIWSMDFVADNLFDGRKLRDVSVREAVMVATAFMPNEMSKTYAEKEAIDTSNHFFLSRKIFVTIRPL